MATPIDTAWQLHAAQMEWTGKVDAKAGFALTLAAAAVATGVALSADGMVFHGIADSWAHVPYGLSLVLLIAAVFTATWAVAPALRPGNLKNEAEVDFIYFGHARYWTADNLAEALYDRDPLPAVTRQVTRMAKIAWKKHRRVAWATWLTGAGVLLMALAGWGLS